MLKERQDINTENIPVDFAKMGVGLQKIDDALINLSVYKKINPSYGNKLTVLKAIYDHNYAEMREISNYYYENSGIYQRLCKYLAAMYRYDWFVTPYLVDVEKEKANKVLKDFAKVLSYLDYSYLKRLFFNIALDVIKEGIYYGIIMDFGDYFSIQKLPADFCRSRYSSGITPIVELNLAFFDRFFPNPQYKIKILQTFPKEIQQAYIAYQRGKLKPEYAGEVASWVALDAEMGVCFTLGGSEIPCLMNVIPSIIDLDQAQELDRKKMTQQLLKILVQKLPLDKNFELVFDPDEAKDIHNLAVNMMKRAVGFEVLTTFADVDKIDAKDSNSSTTVDELEKIERTVYNNSGISHNIFNAEGNIAVTNSILADEASIYDMLLQFEQLLNRMVQRFNRKGHYEFRASMLNTTQYNYKELSKIYKEQTQLGYHKMLPQIALGHSQSSILATLTFENEVLHLADIMEPPKSSNTTSSKSLDKTNQANSSKIQNNQQEKSGRPEKEDTEKSDKTIANRQSAG